MLTNILYFMYTFRVVSLIVIWLLRSRNVRPIRRYYLIYKTNFKKKKKMPDYMLKLADHINWGICYSKFFFLFFTRGLSYNFSNHICIVSKINFNFCENASNTLIFILVVIAPESNNKCTELLIYFYCYLGMVMCFGRSKLLSRSLRVKN